MDRIERYPILGLLGKGGMARVFKVNIPVIDKVAALKLLWPDPTLQELLGGDTLETLFTAEARILGALNHPHVVGIWAFDTWHGRPFYLMDYHPLHLGHLMGESARPDDPSRVIPVERALDYVGQILLGLDRLHHSDIIHRDIKPHNMLIHGEHQIKIGDFGLSRRQGVSFRGPRHLKVGSPGYAAPEQMEDPQAADARADIYAVGAMLLRMLSGRLPEPGQALPPLSATHSDLDPSWDSFLESALAPNPSKRYPSAAAMLDALTERVEHWRRQQEQTCALAGEDSPLSASPEPEATAAKSNPRHTPLKVSAKKARRVLGLDPLWRPRVYTPNQFRAPSPEILQDDATGLIWQQSGSRYPCTWHAAREYADHLSRQGWAGRRHWRLPTMAELSSLLQPLAQGRQLCLSSAFDPRQTRLWSADRRSYTSAWYVDLELGFAGWLDFTAQLDVRCVCLAGG